MLPRVLVLPLLALGLLALRRSGTGRVRSGAVIQA